MKISKAGIFFNYHEDELLWVWPWKREKGTVFISSLFSTSFPSIREYWQYVGSWNEACRKEKVIGYSEEDVLYNWAKYEFRHNTIILLRNVNVEMKSTIFWKSVDPFARVQLQKDIPVLFFTHEKDARKVIRSISTEFAEAYLFVKGKLVEDNLERKVA